MNNLMRTPCFSDQSTRYYEVVGSVSEFLLESETEYSLKLILACISEHSILMSIPKVRSKYLQLITDSLESNKNLTEISKGGVSLQKGMFNFYPVQSVVPKPIPSVNYCSQITKVLLSDLVVRAANDNALYDIGTMDFIDDCSLRSDLSIYSLLPSEEIRSDLYRYARSINLSKYIMARVNRVHLISDNFCDI